MGWLAAFGRWLLGLGARVVEVIVMAFADAAGQRVAMLVLG